MDRIFGTTCRATSLWYLSSSIENSFSRFIRLAQCLWQQQIVEFTKCRCIACLDRKNGLWLEFHLLNSKKCCSNNKGTQFLLYAGVRPNLRLQGALRSYMPDFFLSYHYSMQELNFLCLPRTIWELLWGFFIWRISPIHVEGFPWLRFESKEAFL